MCSQILRTKRFYLASIILGTFVLSAISLGYLKVHCLGKAIISNDRNELVLLEARKKIRDSRSLVNYSVLKDPYYTVQIDQFKNANSTGLTCEKISFDYAEFKVCVEKAGSGGLAMLQQRKWLTREMYHLAPSTSRNSQRGLYRYWC